MIEKIATLNKFEQKPFHETEQKFLPIFPEKLERFRDQAAPIEQVYLSHPSEAFNLRIRETVGRTGPVYETTLKDAGTTTEHGLNRLEIESAVAADTFSFYRDLDQPSIKKQRAAPAEDIVIDFFEDGHVHAESENPESWSHFLHRHSLENDFVEVTGDHVTDNEWRAHYNFRREHNGHEALKPKPPLNVEAIRHEILLKQIEYPVTIVRISGRSGSGKSTIVRELQEKLDEVNLPSLVLSTDDYHRGKAWLEDYNGGQPWTEWDAPIVYDRSLLETDLQRLRRGEVIAGRHFNFSSEESEAAGTIQPRPVILLEGIYARHEDFSDIADLSYEVPTPLATCIGRRILRDMIERPQFAQPERSLRYALEQAEPAYRQQCSA